LDLAALREKVKEVSEETRGERAVVESASFADIGNLRSRFQKTSRRQQAVEFSEY